MQTHETKGLAVVNAQDENFRTTPLTMCKRIGSTVYEVNLCFNQDTKETMEDKILRVIRNDLNNPPADGNMAVPQANRPPERSSVA